MGQRKLSQWDTLPQPPQQALRVQVRVTVEHLKCLMPADGLGFHHVESLLK